MPTVHARALIRAAEILGGIDEFSRHVGVPPYDLMRWMKGEAPPPLSVFLKAVDILSEDETARLGIITSPTEFHEQRGLRVLVIDDRDDIRYITAKRLRALGHEVYEAPDGATGIEQARLHRPEVALVDIMLPDMQGYEVARLLRAEFGHTLRIAAVTAFTELDANKSLQAGFERHFQSPVETLALERWLATAGN